MGRYNTLAAMALAGAALAAPIDAQAQTLAGRSVKIGCLAPVTGKGAEWGIAGKASMEIAVEEINAKGGVGGIPIELICYDTQTLEAEALKSASRLVERDKVLAISGPCFSGEFEIIAPQLDSQFKTVINSYCSAKPGLSAMSKWAFRNTLTSDKQLKPVVEAWVKEYKMKKVVIIYDAEDAVSKGEGDVVLPALFKAHGIEVLDKLTYRTKDTDYSAQVTKAKSLGAEGIGLGSCYQNAAAIAKEMAKQGLNVPIIGGACAGAPGFIEIAGKAAEGAYMSTAAFIDDPRPEVQAYAKKIIAKIGSKPPYSGPRAYDIIYSYKHCIEKSGVTNKPAELEADRDRMRECLGGLKGFPGVAGEITMDAVRDGAGASAILKVVNGAYVNVAQ
jgi:branched-chain amino acid transport system substrate-binding protein